MNIVRILPIIADDGQPLWQLPHFRAPFLKPNTIYEFSDFLVKHNTPLRVRSCRISMRLDGAPLDFSDLTLRKSAHA